MAIVVQIQTGSPNTTYQFEFENSVISYAVGISYFSFSYGSDDHHVDLVSMNINTSKPSDKMVHADVTSQLSDSSGNRIDNGSSSITLICVAQTADTDNNLVLANANGIGNGLSSNPISLPSNALQFSQTGLSGFDLSYGSDHHVQQMIVGTGFTQAGTTGEITATVSMQDSSGNRASTANANGILIAGDTAETGLLVQTLTGEQSGSAVTANFDQSISDAVVLLNKLQINYSGKDHHVKTIGAGTKSWSIVNNTQVLLDSAMAFISDDSGHSQDDDTSYVNMAVIAIPG